MNIEYQVEEFSLKSERAYMDVNVSLEGFIELTIPENLKFPISTIEELDFVYTKLKDALLSVNRDKQI